MKKMTKILALTVFIHFLPLTDYADVVIGSGTLNNPLPIAPSLNYTYSQNLYLQSEIGTSGTITTLSFYFSGTSLSGSNTWVIYIGHTTKTAFSGPTDWVPVGSMTQVYSSTFTSPSGSGWLTFDITDFYYNGTNNLVIAVDENNTGVTAGTNYFYSSTAGTTARSLCYISTSTNPNPSSPLNGGLRQAFANITLGGLRPCGTCTPADAALGTIGTTVYGYNVSGNCGNGKWVGSFTGEAGYDYHFDLCPDSPGSGTHSDVFYDPDIKVTDASCNIIDGADGLCSEVSFTPNDFRWTCSTAGTYYVIIAPDPSYETHECTGTTTDTFTMNYYKSPRMPDVIPHMPLEWNDYIPIGITQLSGSSSHQYDGPYKNNQVLYFNWASANIGSLSASSYTVHVEVTGYGGTLLDWNNITTGVNYYSYLPTDVSVGPLTVGEHTFKVWVDYNNVLTEYDETNNYYERTINVVISNSSEMIVPSTGNNSYTVCSGHLYDAAGSEPTYGYYDDGWNGYTVLHPSQAGKYTQVYGTLSTEEGCDYLEIYDGVGTAGNLIYSGSGDQTVPHLTSSDASRSLTVKFSSDIYGGIGMGFDLNINCIDGCIPPSDPVVSGLSTICQGGTAYLSATSANATIIYWYTGSCGETGIGTSSPGVDFAVPVYYNNTYYAKGYNAETGNCWSLGCGSKTITITPNQWTGATSTDWNTATNWCGGVPSISQNVEIPAGTVHQPHVTSQFNNPAYCQNLTIDAGAVLTIDPGKALTVVNNLTNNAGESGIIIKSDASGTGSLINYTSGVHAKVENYLTKMKWHFIGMPVVSGVAGVFHLPEGHSDIWLKPHIETTNTWGTTIMPSDSSLVLGKGYECWVGNNSFNNNETVVFPGILNASSYTTGTDGFYGLTYTGSGYNFISNPYPSALMGKINQWAKTNVSNSIWVWQGTGSTMTGGGNYLTYNGTTGSLPAGIIPPMQGFFVKATGTGATLTIPQSHRTHSYWPFYKDSGLPLNTLRLDVEGNDCSDAVFIGFDPIATEGCDPDFDVMKMYGMSPAPQLYCIIPENNLSINILPEIGDNRIVPLGFECEIPSTFTIEASGMDGFDVNTEFYLEDLKDGIIQDIGDNPDYVFTGDPGDNPERFILHFGNPNAVSENGYEPIRVFSYERRINVIIPESGKTNIVMYDLLGREIFSRQVNGMDFIQIETNAQRGIYIVRVQNSERLIQKKLFIE
jgi:hypothetical protein